MISGWEDMDSLDKTVETLKWSAGPYFILGGIQLIVEYLKERKDKIIEKERTYPSREVANY
jgi:hypothetical protein